MIYEVHWDNVSRYGSKNTSEMKGKRSGQTMKMNRLS